MAATNSTSETAQTNHTYHVINNALHIKFPFSLLDNVATEGGIRSPRREGEVDQLFRLYPGTTSVDFGDVLALTVKTLPPKPWPLTIAGAPCWIQTDQGPYCPDFLGRRWGRGDPVITDVKARGHISDEDLARVLAYFDEHHPQVTAVRYCFYHWDSKVDGEVPRDTTLPKQVAGLFSMYDDDIERPHYNPGFRWMPAEDSGLRCIPLLGKKISELVRFENNWTENANGEQVVGLLYAVKMRKGESGADGKASWEMFAWLWFGQSVEK